MTNDEKFSDSIPQVPETIEPDQSDSITATLPDCDTATASTNETQTLGNPMDIIPAAFNEPAAPGVCPATEGVCLAVDSSGTSIPGESEDIQAIGEEKTSPLTNVPSPRTPPWEEYVDDNGEISPEKQQIDHIAEFYAAKIKKHVRETSQSGVIEIAYLCFKATEQLKTEKNRKPLLEKTNMSKSTFSKYLTINTAARFIKPYIALLPAGGMSPIYEIAIMDADRRKQMFEDGTIHAGITRKELLALKEPTGTRRAATSPSLPKGAYAVIKLNHVDADTTELDSILNSLKKLDGVEVLVAEPPDGNADDAVVEDAVLELLQASIKKMQQAKPSMPTGKRVLAELAKQGQSHPVVAEIPPEEKILENLGYESRDRLRREIKNLYLMAPSETSFRKMIAKKKRSIPRPSPLTDVWKWHQDRPKTAYC